jgi:hypothetical protein
VNGWKWRADCDNESQGGKTEERAGLVGQLRTASAALQFAVRTVSTTAADQESQCNRLVPNTGCLGEALIIALNADFSRISPRDEYGVSNRQQDADRPPDRGY